MTEMVPFLRERGFEPVETDFAGGWSTDGEWTVQASSIVSPATSPLHTVRVFDAPAHEVTLETPVIGEAHDGAHGVALSRAFAEAEAAVNRDGESETDSVGAQP